MSEFATVTMLDNGFIEVVTDGAGTEVFNTSEDAIAAYIDCAVPVERIEELSLASSEGVISKSQQEELAWGLEANAVINGVKALSKS